MSEIKQRHVWGQVYRGIFIEAVTWSWSDEVKSQSSYLNKENWCGYMYLDSTSHPEITNFEVDFESKWTDRVPYFDRLPFHGGVTLSEVTKHRETLRMKIGCDYQHYGDEGWEYDSDIVMRDMRAVVDSYRGEFPEKPKEPTNYLAGFDEASITKAEKE